MTHSGEGGEGQCALLSAVADALIVLWQRHARSPRLATPLLRTVEVLLLHTFLLQPDRSASADAVGELPTPANGLTAFSKPCMYQEHTHVEAVLYGRKGRYLLSTHLTARLSAYVISITQCVSHHTMYTVQTGWKMCMLAKNRR